MIWIIVTAAIVLLGAVVVFSSLFGRREDEPPPPPPAPAESFTVASRRQMTDLSRRVRAHGNRLPTHASVVIGRIEDLVYPLLDHLEVNPPAVEEEIAVSGLIADYLPSTVNAYLALPPMMLEQRNSSGRTAEEELIHQLELLEAGVRETTVAIYTHDAQALAVQGRFLEAKIKQTDLLQ